MEHIIETTTGKVLGYEQNGNKFFLGIPYGDQCDGEFRFLPPRPVSPWKGVYDCTRLGPAAMQNGVELSEMPDAVRGIYVKCAEVFTGGIRLDDTANKYSENCLVLNAATPGCDEKKRPVLVYIHGGGFASGSGNVTAQTCGRLLSEEDVVVFTVNHRLNILGYLYLGGFDPKYELSGIAGLLDIVLALQWIKANAAGFGGNPENITLIGESGGAMKICNLLAMPEARGLFDKVILLSGATEVGTKTKEDGEREALEVLKTLGIPKEDWRRLLTVEPAKLLSLVEAASMEKSITMSFSPVADGLHLPENPEKKFLTYEWSKHIPMIIGASEDELGFPVITDPALTWEGLRAELLADNEFHQTWLPGINENNVDEIIHACRYSDDKDKAPWHVLVQIRSMCSFLGAGAFEMSDARIKETDAPVWHYTVTYDTPVAFPEHLRCAWHTAELPLAFRAVYHKEMEMLSKRIAHAFAAFARCGSPSTDMMAWHAFTSENKETLMVDEVCQVKYDPYNNIHKYIDMIRKKNCK